MKYTGKTIAGKHNTGGIKMKWHGNYIIIDKGITAIPGYEGNMPTLKIKKNGKQTQFYRGSSLGFSDPLTDEDQRYLRSLAKLEDNK